MTSIEQYLTAVASLGSAHAKFILKHGRAFEPDLLTFKGWTGEPKNCFGNAALYALTRDPTLTYVEGFVNVIIPVHHAWLARDDGSIIDPTLRIEGGGIDGGPRIGPAPHAYFGVPFNSDFVRKFILKTQTYGLLDGMSKASIALMTGKTKPSKFLAKETA
jgi:hypothetical protein